MNTKNKKSGFDFESFKEQAMSDIYQGKKMGGPERALKKPQVSN